MARAQDGSFIKSQIYTIKVPQVNQTKIVCKFNFLNIVFYLEDTNCISNFQIEGGSFLSLKMSWSQKLLYHDGGEFCLRVPFSFPAYVTPVAKKISKKEKILLNMNSGTGTEVICRSTSHPLKVNHGPNSDGPFCC